MKLIFDRPLGNGNPYAPSQKCFWGAVIGAGASLLGNMLGNQQQAGYTKEQQKLQSRLNREEMNHSMDLQQNYQNMLWNEGAAKSVSGMKNAGLNPAMAGGSSLGGASGSGGLAKPSSGSSGPSASQGSPLGSQAVAAAMDVQQTQSNVELNKSQADLNEANAAYLEQKTTEQKNVNSKFAETYAREAARVESETNRNISEAGFNRAKTKTEGVNYENALKIGRKIEKEVDKLYEECNVLRSEAALNKTKRYELLSRLRQDIMNNIVWRENTRMDTRKKYADMMANLLLSESQATREYYQSELMSIQAELDAHYGKEERRSKVVSNYFNGVGLAVFGLLNGLRGRSEKK